MKSNWKVKFVLTGLLGVFALYQNCGQSFVASLKVQESNLSSGAPNDDTSPVPVAIPILASWDDEFPQAVKLDSCETDTRVNLCVIDEDPVTANGGGFAPPLTPNSSTPAIEKKIFSYGIKVPDSGPLKNKHFYIAMPAGASTTLVSPNKDKTWKYSYKDDTNHNVAQINSWYWLNRERSYFVARTGKYYYSNQSAAIYAYSPKISDNAYFSATDNSMNIGVRNFTAGQSGDLALDGSVIAHEAGHGDLNAASGGASLGGGETMMCQAGYPCCKTKDGCFGGIHEGVGDIHAFILFPDRSPTGRYFSNSSGGLRDPASVKTRSLTAAAIYARHNGEIHDMGEVYGSIWWEVWKKHRAAGSEKDIEILFEEHLSGLGTNDTFVTAYTTITQMAKSILNSKASGIIDDFRTEYTRMGVPIP